MNTIPIEEKLKKLLGRKKLTGDNLGKLILKDLGLSKQKKDILGEGDLSAIESIIIDLSEIKEYYPYKAIHSYLLSMTLDYELERSKLNLYYLDIVRYFTMLLTAEEAYNAFKFQPRIMTRRDYELCIEQNKENIERQEKRQTFSFIRLISYELSKALPKYEAGEKTEYNAIFDELRSLALTDGQETHLKKVSKALCEELTINNQYEYLLKHAKLYLPKAKGNTKERPYFFKKDFESLTKAILNKYSKYEGLEFLTKLKKSDYTREDLISFKLAHELDILSARTILPNPCLEWKGYPLVYGVAIVEEDPSFMNNAKIREGSFYYRLAYMHYINIAENFLKNEEVIKDIATLFNLIKQSMKRLNGFSYALDMIIQITGVKELESFRLKNTEEFYNDIVEKASYLKKDIIFRHEFLRHEEPVEELRQKLLNVFMPHFTLEDVAIQPDEVKEVEKIISTIASKDSTVNRLTKYLTGLKA